MKTKNEKYLYNKNWIKNHSWYSHYNKAEQRCNNPKNNYYYNYGGRGIKFLMTSKDFKYLWFRDKAYLLKRPSIDRIDNDGNYEISNCRFIELVKNIRRGKRYRGSHHYISKLTEKQVKKIRKLYATNKFTQKELSIKFKVSFQMISDIIRYIKWRHI